MEIDPTLKEKVDTFFADKNKSFSIMKLCAQHVNTGGGILWITFDKDKSEYSFVHKNNNGWNDLLEQARFSATNYDHINHYLILFSLILDDGSARSMIVIKHFRPE